MKLTIENNPEAIKRYRHIRPAPLRGLVSCSAQCPGTLHTCTLLKGHPGFHVAHGRFKKVVAVWDKGFKAPTHQKPKRVVRTLARRDPERGKLVPTFKGFWGRLVRGSPSIEEIFLLVLALSMAAFAIDWALRILGYW